MYYQQASHGLDKARLLQTVMNSSVVGEKLFTDNSPEDRREGGESPLASLFFALLAYYA